jgi:hypothetical protein
LVSVAAPSEAGYGHRVPRHLPCADDVEEYGIGGPVIGHNSLRRVEVVVGWSPQAGTIVAFLLPRGAVAEERGAERSSDGVVEVVALTYLLLCSFRCPLFLYARHRAAAGTRARQI